MKPVSDLYGAHPGSDIYVVGTGASLRVFPPSFLEGRITIGLNMAWKMLPVQYGITVHPDLNIPEFIPGEAPRPEITWVVKREKFGGMDPEQVRYADEHYYYFRTDAPERVNAEVPRTPGKDEVSRVVEWVRRPTENYLYVWSSISQPAANLAANMGAKNVILVGCDNAALLGNHHAHDQHTRWLGTEPDQRYRDYYDGLAEVRGALRERGVNLVSLNPFLTLGPHDHDFTRLCEELELPVLIENEDITETYRAPWEQRPDRGSGTVLRRGLRPLRKWAGTVRRRLAQR